jgi:5-methylthioadenosine/S-adenosylhomocysteine deaminase
MTNKEKLNKKVDLILHNAVVLTMNESLTQFNPGAVAVEGPTILDVGSQETILSDYSARELIDLKGRVLMPGLINTHTHAPMTLLRGLADDLRLDVWLLGYMMPVEREYVSPQFVQLGTSLACIEMIQSGITCFADMYYFEEHVAQATARAGMRAVCSQTVLKFPSPDAAYYEESMESARQFIQDWKGHPLIVPSVAPHAPYTCTDEILIEATELAREFDVPIQIHISETEQETINFRSQYGMPVVPYVKKLGLLDAKVVAAHCVHVDDGEIQTLKHHGSGVAHNPSSNMKLASGFAPVKRMIDEGLNVGIGTDGTASNNDLDMFEEMRLASFMSKNYTSDPTALPATTILEMATRIGAKSIFMDDLIGTIDPGKRADLITIDISTVHNSPRFLRNDLGIYAQIVYASKSSDVIDVMVDGSWVMRNHKLVNLDSEGFLTEAAEIAHRIDAFLIEREKSVFSKLLAIAGASEEESFEVQVKVRINNLDEVIDKIKNSEIEVLYSRHYHEYDTYFLFENTSEGVLRYREDEFIDESGEVENIRYRLTLIGPTREAQMPGEVLLSRSRYLAQAEHSLRFYREYFEPVSEVFVEKDRLRWRVLFHDTVFYINIDRIDQPDLGTFLEIKSRTWSKRDADIKAEIAVELIEFLGASEEDTVTVDYLEMANSENPQTTSG